MARQAPPKPRSATSETSRGGARPPFSELRRRGRLQREAPVVAEPVVAEPVVAEPVETVVAEPVPNALADEVDRLEKIPPQSDDWLARSTSAPVLHPIDFRQEPSVDESLDKPLDVQSLPHGVQRMAIVPRAVERVVDCALASEENRRAYDQIVTRLIEDVRGFPNPCIGLAAADTGGDSTLVIASLAELFAKRLGSVLLLDGDSKQRCLSLLYGVADRPGVSDAVRGVGQLTRNVYSTSRQIDIVPAGTNFQYIDPPTPENWGDLVHKAKAISPLTLVDLGVIQAGSSAQLARLCEAVYLVVTLDRTERYYYDDATRQLPLQGIRLQGAIAVL